jgi:hypothetical protein
MLGFSPNTQSGYRISQLPPMRSNRLLSWLAYQEMTSADGPQEGRSKASTDDWKAGSVEIAELILPSTQPVWQDSAVSQH